MTTFVGFDGRLRTDAIPQFNGFRTTTSRPVELTGQTAALASFMAIVTPNDGLKHFFEIAVVVTITATGTGSINAEINYTDDSGVARTKIIPLTNTAGATSAAAVSAVDTYTGVVVIAVNPNTTITVLNAGVYTGGFTYNMAGASEEVG